MYRVNIIQQDKSYATLVTFRVVFRQVFLRQFDQVGIVSPKHGFLQATAYFSAYITYLLPVQGIS
jgi:hypothetical protein